MPDPSAGARATAEPLPAAPLEPGADPSRAPAAWRRGPEGTCAGGPAARRRPARETPPPDPLVDLCAVLRRIQDHAAAARAELGRFPGGRRAARVEQRVADIELAAEVGAALVAELDRQGPGR